MKELYKKYNDVNPSQAEEIIKSEIGAVFEQVLLDAGVYKRDEYRAAAQAPVADSVAGHAYCLHLGVSRSVMLFLSAISPAADNFAVFVGYHAADRHFARLGRLTGKLQRKFHIFFPVH